MVINATKGAPVLNEKDNSISLSAIETYPNPCTDHLSVKCSDLTTDAVLNIYSVSGALVKNIKIAYIKPNPEPNLKNSQPQSQ